MATLKKTKNWLSRPIMLNAGQKYCRILQVEHSAILSTFIKLPFIIKLFVLSIFELLFSSGFTVLSLVTDNNPSRISGRRRMTLEIIS